MSVNLAEQPKLTTNPNIERLPVTLQALSAKVGKSRKGAKMATITLEIVAPDKEIPDKDGNLFNPAGSKVSMFVMLEGQGLIGTAEIHNKLGLPMDIDPDDESAIERLYGNLCFTGWASTKPNHQQEWDPVQSKMVNVVDPETGNTLPPVYQWQPIGSRDIRGPANKVYATPGTN